MLQIEKDSYVVRTRSHLTPEAMASEATKMAVSSNMYTYTR